MNSRDMFDRAKLQLYRLNNTWSPGGEVFCYRVQTYLDRAVWDENNCANAVVNLAYADRALSEAYMQWNDTARDTSLDSWNAVYSAAQDYINNLVDCLPNKLRCQFKNV